MHRYLGTSHKPYGKLEAFEPKAKVMDLLNIYHLIGLQDYQSLGEGTQVKSSIPSSPVYGEQQKLQDLFLPDQIQVYNYS